MRDQFPGYYRPSDEDFVRLWRNDAVFVFDANVLLNLYRYTEGTRLKFLDLIPHLKERVWLPHQAALEFQRGRPGVILEQEAIYEQVEADLKKTAERIRERVEAIRREDEGHPLLAIAMTCNGLAAKARKHKDDHPNLLEHDPVVEAHLAITLIKHRLRNSYGDDVEFKVVGEPVSSDTQFYAVGGHPLLRTRSS